MDFNELNDYIPYVVGGKEKVLTCSPYKGIELAMPGKHATETSPVGGDFVVRVTDPALKWRKHEFSHNDIFNGMAVWKDKYGYHDQAIIHDYYDVVVNGLEPKECEDNSETLFLQAIQALAVAEHRRYAKYEIKFGGRYLPFRFAAGIAEGLWTAGEAAANQKRGRPGVEYLESIKGVPTLTKELMK